MTQQTKPTTVSRARPCEVCNGDHKCAFTADGLILCGRQSGEIPGYRYLGPAKHDSQFSLYRHAEDQRQHERNGHTGNSRPVTDWHAKADAYAKAFSTGEQQALATALGLPAPVVAGHGIGYMQQGPHRDDDGNCGPCWTFPEQDGTGSVVGISCRYQDSQKKAIAGSARGLFVPTGWKLLEGPILCPEGPSDALALTALDLPAIGRPNNCGGATQLAELLKDQPPDRQIVILGEYDPKPDGRWPGKEGAFKCASELAAKLNRTVSVAFPPNGQKDVRKWALSRFEDRDAGYDLGEELVEALQYVEVKAAALQGYRFQPIDSPTFFSRDYRQTWLVERLLVRGQPCVMGGPKKSLKTTFLVALAIAISSATLFLGRFKVYRALRVALLSGESGEFTIQETARRICVAMDIDPASLSVVWDFKLPQLADQTHMDTLSNGLREAQIDVLMIDPAYLCLLAGEAGREIEPSNYFQMGPLLLNITQACLSVDCTPILAFHTKKALSKPWDPMELEDLAYAGIAEFARQWLFVNRRKQFEPGTGQHQLWLGAGGSVGHSSCWAVDVDEGQLDENFGGRKWEVVVAPRSEAVKQEVEAKDEKREQRATQKDKSDDAKLLKALDKLDPERKGYGLRKLKEAAHFGTGTMTRAILRLVDEGIVEECTVEVATGSKAKREAQGLRRLPSKATEGDHRDERDGPSGQRPSQW